MSEKNKEYFEKQIKGLLMILSDGHQDEKFITRDYMAEKLKMILSDGINFHPLIKEKLEKE